MDADPLPVTALRSYMRAAGWTEGTHGTAGSLWTKGPYRFAVPHEDDDQVFVRGAVERLAQAEGRTPDETAAAVLAYRQMSEPAKACGCGPLEPCGEHLGAEAHPGITRWRQKTPEIEATRWDGTAVDATRVINWILAAGGTARYHDEPPGFIALDIPGGMVRSLAGDWITACRDGSFRPLTEAGFFNLLEPAGVLVSGGAETDAAVPEADDTGQHPPAAHAQPQERTDLPANAREAAYRAYRAWHIGSDGEGRLHAALVAYERQRAGHVVPAEARHLIAQAEAADTAYRLAEARVTVYEFLHQYGLSELPLFKVAIDLAVSLRKIIDGTGEADHG